METGFFIQVVRFFGELVICVLMVSPMAFAGKYDRPPAEPALVEIPSEGDVPLGTTELGVLEPETFTAPEGEVPVFEAQAPVAKESVDSWFKGGLKEVSLSALKLILPSFIQLTPESKLLGNLKWNIRGFSQASVSADVTFSGIYLVHSGLADRPVNLSGLHLRGEMLWDRGEETLTFENVSLSRAGVTLYVDGHVSYQNTTAVRLHVTLPETPIQSVLTALPADLIPKLQGAQVQGTIALDTNFVADPSNPAESLFDPGIRVSNYSLVQAPPGANIPALKSDFTQEIKRNGQVVRTVLLSKSNPQYVPYEQLGENTRQAILRAEDMGFFAHNGFNLGAIREALNRDLNARRFARGGSTITMQLAKNLFLNGRRNLSRKLQEAILTYALEHELDKKRIFEIYANIIEWGVNVYGISEATQHYFYKEPALLDSEEASQLASIIKSPVKRDFKNTSGM